MSAQFIRRPLPSRLTQRDPALITDTYKTTYGANHKKPYSLSTAHNLGRVHCGHGMALKIHGARLETHPPRPMTIFTSTMRDTYPAHDVSASKGMTVQSIQEQTTCKLNRVGFDCEKPFPVQKGGYTANLDFMLPTTAKDFRPYCSEEIPAEAPITIYTAKGIYRPKAAECRILADPRPHPSFPFWDEAISKKICLYRSITPRSTPVPNKGMTSETTDCFKHPIDEFTAHSIYPILEFPLQIYPYQPPEFLKVPGMYVPESAHYGSRIPVSTFVDIGPRSKCHE